MLSLSSRSALVAAALLSLLKMASADSVVSIATPTYTGARSAMTAKGCFSESEPLEDHGEYTFQSQGNCQGICLGLSMPVMGLVNGTNCWCGAEMPPKDTQVDDDKCNTPCAGYDKQNCGGANYWQVLLDGFTQNEIDYYDGPISSSWHSTTAADSAVTSIVAGGATIVRTIQGSAATSDSSSGGGGGSSTAGIAAGAVVGVLALAGIVGGTFFYLRYRRRRSVEEEYRRQAAVSDFVGAGKAPHTSHSSMTDARLDPEVMMQRRQSDGSIADNEDYSRRILKVTNPDSL